MELIWFKDKFKNHSIIPSTFWSALHCLRRLVITVMKILLQTFWMSNRELTSGGRALRSIIVSTHNKIIAGQCKSVGYFGRGRSREEELGARSRKINAFFSWFAPALCGLFTAFRFTLGGIAHKMLEKWSSERYSQDARRSFPQKSAENNALIHHSRTFVRERFAND